MQDKIRVGIIGVGSIAQIHIAAYRQIEQVELVAFCDSNPTRLTEMLQTHGITRGYTDVNEMLANETLDAVSVCTWNSAHASCSIAALNHGVHVLCEKPMALNLEEALAMKAAAVANQKLLMVGLVKRFGNDVELIKDLVDNGTLGTPYLAKGKYLRRNGSPGGWFSDTARSGGGPLIDLGVHTLDMMTYLLGSPEPISVYGFTFNTIGPQREIKKVAGYQSSNQSDQVYDVEDYAGAVIRFADEQIVQLEASYSLFIEEDYQKLELFGDQGGIQLGDTLNLATNIAGYMANSTLSIETAFDFEAAFLKEIAHFVQCLQGNAVCKAEADEGIKNMRILDAIYASAVMGHEVVIENRK